MSDSLRSKPKQARSQQRYEHILHTAAAMFAEQGYESVTTNHIAARAEVSIGSLYRFFPNKDAILDALVEQYLAEKKALFLQEIDMNEPLAASLAGLVRALMQHEAAQANYGHVFVSVDSAQERLHRTFVQWMRELFAHYYPQHEAAQHELAAHVGVGIIKGLLPLTQAPFSLPPQTVGQELTRALTAYARSAFEGEDDS